MKMTMVLFGLGICLILASAFFFYQRSQLSGELSALKGDHYAAENEVNREIKELGQANEDKRWQWLELGNDVAKVEFSMWKGGVASLGCLVLGVVAGLVGFVRNKRRPGSSPQG